MRQERKYVLSIAGFDPSGGAGLLADIKTFEAHKVHGLGVISANTFQNDTEFLRVDWIPVESIIEQIDILRKRFSFEYIKIGLIENFEVLKKVIGHCLKVMANCRIIWDPILKASAGFGFHKDLSLLADILPKVFLLTPNSEEVQVLGGKNVEESTNSLAQQCHVLLKGGHRTDKPGYDSLYMKEGKQFSFRPKMKEVSSKHGSGCVLSSAIAANLAKGEELKRACLMAKEYTEKFLSSNKTLLGHHKL